MLGPGVVYGPSVESGQGVERTRTAWLEGTLLKRDEGREDRVEVESLFGGLLGLRVAISRGSGFTQRRASSENLAPASSFGQDLALGELGLDLLRHISHGTVPGNDPLFGSRAFARGIDVNVPWYGWLILLEVMII